MVMRVVHRPAALRHHKGNGEHRSVTAQESRLWGTAAKRLTSQCSDPAERSVAVTDPLHPRAALMCSEQDRAVTS